MNESSRNHRMKSTLTLLIALLLAPLAAVQSAETSAASGPSHVIVPHSKEAARNGEASVVELRDGSLLLMYGAHQKAGDWDRGEIRQLRSRDEGKTWSAPETVFSDAKRSLFQIAFARLANGDLGLTHTSLANGRDAFKVFRRSTDEGQTWSEPLKISDDSHDYTTGPWDRLYVLASGRVIALLHCNMKPDAKKQGGPLGTYAVLSDDHGKTWSRSPLKDVLHVPDNPLKKHEWGFWEPALVEHAPGKLLMLGRTTTGWLWESRSEDNGTTWSAPVQSSVPNPVAPPVLTRVPGTETLVLILNPDVKLNDNWHGGERLALAFRTSKDSGRTWSAPTDIYRAPNNKLWVDYPAVRWIKGQLHLVWRHINRATPVGGLGGTSLYHHVVPGGTFAQLAAPRTLPSLSNTPAASRSRRVLYNFDGDSCLTTKANSKGPVAVSVEDVKRLIEEVAYDGSRVDTVLVCINAQVMYYPTKVGTMRGTLSTPEERAKWPASEQQRFTNLKTFFDTGVDPYAIMLAEAKRRGREALLTFRMNDDHGDDFLRTQFQVNHPEWRLGTQRYRGKGALDFGRDEVRDYIFRLLEEAVRRYDSDGLELDFNRFPTFFKDGTTDERVAKMNSLVERVRAMLDTVGRERGHRLILSVRPPSNYGRTPPTPATARQLGCDVPAWVQRGWVDFVAVSEFLHERGDLPIAHWKQAIPSVPIYGGIECTKAGAQKNLSADEYRHAAPQLLKAGADGIYLFNFFTSREGGANAYEPPFAVLRDLGQTAATPGEREKHPR